MTRRDSTHASSADQCVGSRVGPSARSRATPWSGRWLAIGTVVALLLGGAGERRVEAAQPPPGLEIAATGDITLGKAGLVPAGGSKKLLAGVATELRAPVSLGNLETALVDDAVASRIASKCPPASSDCYAFRAPEAFAQGLRDSGFTILNLANNHSNDFGRTGRARTVAALTRAGLRSTGAPGQITVLRVGGARVAVLGFAPYPWAANLLDLRAARRLVSEAARRAEIVVVTMHIGAEGADRMRVPRGPETYLGEPRGNSRAFTHAVVDAGADLVVGHGPHVLRGMEWYRGRLIAHSLGNFSAFHTLRVTGDLGHGAILKVTLDRTGRFIRGRVVPVKLVGLGTPVRDARGRSIDLLRRLSSVDFGQAGVRLDGRGGIAVPRASARRSARMR